MNNNTEFLEKKVKNKETYICDRVQNNTDLLFTITIHIIFTIPEKVII